MTEEIYQTIKCMLEEVRGDRYPRLARLLAPAEPHIKVNYEGSDQVTVGEALAREKDRHDKITAALEWLESEHSTQGAEVSQQELEVSDATEKGVEPSNDLPEHTGDEEIGAPTGTSSSGSVEQRSEEQEDI